MENKRNEQLSLDFENKGRNEPQPGLEQNPDPPAAVISFREKKAERERVQEGKLYKQILNLVKNF
jgi:hypothetical protein